MAERVECRRDGDALLEAARRARAFFPAEPWAYAYSMGRHHYFRHRFSGRYRVWVGDVDGPPKDPRPDASDRGTSGSAAAVSGR